jgi:hypothetical protein
MAVFHEGTKRIKKCIHIEPTSLFGTNYFNTVEDGLV